MQKTKFYDQKKEKNHSSTIEEGRKGSVEKNRKQQSFGENLVDSTSNIILTTNRYYLHFRDEETETRNAQ